MAITLQDTISQGLISQIGQNQNGLSQTFRQLSTGLRINQASDNAALLSIATQFSSEARGINQAVRNANDGISLTQVAEGGLAQVDSGFARLQELAVQSANGTLNDSDRAAIQAEADQIQSQISDVISNTEFNGQSLLASGDTLSLQTGPNEGDQTDVSLTDYSAAFTSVDLSTQAGAQSALTSLAADRDTVSSARAQFGAAESGLASTANQLTSASIGVEESRSRMVDTDFAQATADQTKNLIQSQAGVSLLAQRNNLNAELTLQLLQ